MKLWDWCVVYGRSHRRNTQILFVKMTFPETEEIACRNFNLVRMGS
jgi:hypothetical protein